MNSQLYEKCHKLGGRNASRAGKKYEDKIGEILKYYNVKVFTNKEYCLYKKLDILPERYAVSQYDIDGSIKFKKSKDGSITKKTNKIDYYVFIGDPNPTETIFHQKPLQFCIECKWQNSDGTAWQKLPYAITEIKKHSPTKFNIILIDGEFFTNEMHFYFKDWCAGNYGSNLIKEMQTNDFINWMTRVTS